MEKKQGYIYDIYIVYPSILYIYIGNGDTIEIAMFNRQTASMAWPYATWPWDAEMWGFPRLEVNFMENPNLKWMIWGYPVFLGFSHCISRRVATMGTLLRSDKSLHHISARHQPLRRVPQSDHQTAKEKIPTEILQGSSHLAGFIPLSRVHLT